MTIQNSDSKSVNWVFSRELLINVLTSTNGTACGDGDVKVSLANKFLSISVGTNATNRVTISYPAVLVQKFIDRTTDLICPGNETFFITIPDTIDLMFPDAQSL